VQREKIIAVLMKHLSFYYMSAMIFDRIYTAWLFTIDPRLNVQSFIEASNYIKKGVTILQILRNNEKRDFY